MKLFKSWFVLAVALVLVSFVACSSDSNEGVDGDTDSDGDIDIEGEAFVAPENFEVFISPDAPKGVKIVAEDLNEYLNQMGFISTLTESTELQSCEADSGKVVFVGDGLHETNFEGDTTDQTWMYDERRCETGALVLISGGGLLGRQYAGYEWLHLLGVRFFHPEEEFVPETPAWPSDEAKRQHTPDFKYRSASLHLTHPLALGDVFKNKDPQYLQDALNFIDWQFKNGASEGHSGIAIDGNDTYGLDRGYPTGAGFSLYGSQQGSNGLMDPDDPRPADQQITDAIDERMGDDPENYPDFFSFSFNPTEFTEIDDQLAVHQMTLITEYVNENYPGTQVITTNHGTAGEPTDHYGVRYYDLPKFAPKELAIKMHTLMFYDLFRPAPVYGNEDFNHFYDFMEEVYQERKLWYFPESAWWLTFDNQLPLYLPITIEARDRDIQGIKHMLDGGLVGHRVFGSGHEWGYWQNEYCPFRMSMDVNYRYEDCLKDITSPMGAAAEEVMGVMQNVVIQQENEFIYGDILAYMVGSDPETEAAASLGIVFHPLPATPNQIMKWDADEVASWYSTEAKQLQDSAAGYETLLSQMDDAKTLVPENGMSWFNEIYDGIAINGIRAKHQYQAYTALVKNREAQLEAATDSDKAASLVAEAKDLFANAKETTQLALETVSRREEGYRYRPLSRYNAGGEKCNEDDNWTTYDFRVHCRTHTAYYYVRIDQLVEEALVSGSQVVQVPDTLLTLGESVMVNIIDPEVSNITVDFGDGNTANAAPFENTYAGKGVYEVVVNYSKEGSDMQVEVSVAVVEKEYYTGFSGKITQPDGLGLVEPVMPALAFGKIDDDNYIMGFSAESENYLVLPGQFAEIAAKDNDDFFSGTAALLNVPIISKADDAILAPIIIGNADLSLPDTDSKMELTGTMSIDSVLEAVMVVGGVAFTEDNVRDIVSAQLGYTPETLPENLPFVIEYTLKVEE